MRRVVITGLGVVSSIGIGWRAFWSSLIEGKSGISRITSFDTSQFKNHMGGEVKIFKPEVFIEPDKLKMMGRTSQMAVAAAKMAIEDAGLSEFEHERAGVYMGTTNGEACVLESIVRNFLEDMEDEIKPVSITKCPNNTIPNNVALETGFFGPNGIITTACAAGNYAIANSFNTIQLGRADVMLAGGADSFSWLTFVGFNRLSAVAPEKCQPFDKNRKGIITAEGAGVVLLEALDRAKRRGANIYCEVKGYGMSCDAFHMTAPLPEGVEMVIKDALRHANISKDDVQYINAHGTGTPANDKSETAGIKKVFGSDYKKIPVSSIKSMIGHSMGAASALEAIATALTVKYDIIPPTINYETPDPECDIYCVTNKALERRVNIALNNSFAFGGNNACLVLGKP
ncbi:MAG: beta-ketoacyl-[acyl-carrier-protein] synthase family protein [Nitrospirae bacterium]|nr:MAG: beta-ketoacyl-[acyl-carrier-protein] synthase family protein [Nitrospirota bacterium]